MAADGGGGDTIVIGTKFDQPGLGLKNPDGTMSGFDVDVATYVAERARLQPRQDRVEGIAVGAAREPDPERPGQLHRGDLLDHRRTQGEGRLRRAVPAHRAEPAGAVRQQRHHRSGVAAEQQEPVLGLGFDTGAEDQGRVPGSAAAAVRHLLGVHRGAQERCGGRRHDRRGHPGRVRRAEPGRVQDRRRAVLRGALRHRPEEGRRRAAHQDQRRAQEDGDSGAWKAAFDKNLGPAGITAPAPPPIDQ